MKREKERKEGQKKRLRGLWGRQISNCQVNVSNRQIPKLDRFLTNDVKKKTCTSGRRIISTARV